MNKVNYGDEICVYEDFIDSLLLSALIKHLNDLPESEWEIRFGSKLEDGSWDLINGGASFVDIHQIPRNEQYFVSPIMENVRDCLIDFLNERGLPFDSKTTELFRGDVLNIDRHHPGTKLKAHYDTVPDYAKKTYTILFYINDDYLGGELSFKVTDNPENLEELIPEDSPPNGDADFSFKVKAGSVVVFPSDAPYYHAAHKIRSGVKYLVKANHTTEYI